MFNKNTAIKDNDYLNRAFAKVRFDNSYTRLPERFYTRLNPVPVKAPRLIRYNEALGAELGLDRKILTDELAAGIFSGNFVPADAEPIAMAYAGHQFGGFVPQLGDGRAILLGEIINIYGARRDIQLKGSGQTPFSRQADGRAPLGPVIREYIVSEAMQALGIPTTRSLAAVATGETVYRETPLPGAVLTRVATSHIRAGTFEYFAARGDREGVKQLADYVIKRLYPEVLDADNPYGALLNAVIARQAKLVARWMHVGFIHGVMNTDNTAISGETIDYGPCAFMDSYDPATVFSSIDAYGRYAYGNQPYIAQWNLARFAETLLPLIDNDSRQAIEKAETAIEAFASLFDIAWLDGMRKKLGFEESMAGDKEIIEALLRLMQAQGADFTLTFRALCTAANFYDFSALQELLGHGPEAKDWFAGWQSRLAQESRPPAEQAASMRAVNPAYIPRNHRVEQAIQAAVMHEDYTVIDTLLDVLATPFEERDEFASFMLPPTPEERVRRTFCGT